MLRDKNLIPLSHQHQHALALCVRIDRGVQPDQQDVGAWCDEVALLWSNEISLHFLAEEEALFPVAAGYCDLSNLVSELISEHQRLREYFRRSSERNLNAQELRELATQLSAHIRKEERQLFEGCQQVMPADLLSELGQKLDKALAAASHSCALPNPALAIQRKQEN